MNINYYDILNISHDASSEEIKESFRKMAKKYHPDSSDNKNSDSFNIICEAYKILTNQKLKKKYDESLLVNKSIDKQTGYIIIPQKRIRFISSIGNLIDSGLWTKKQLTRKQRLDHFNYDLSISITKLEHKKGVIVRIALPATGICYACYGTDQLCYLCSGLGKFKSMEEVDILIPPNINTNKIFNVNLKKLSPGKMIKFTINDLNILIRIL